MVLISPQLVLLLLPLVAAADLIKQSAQEVTVQRNSRTTQTVVFELCGGLSESHDPRLIVYQNGNQNISETVNPSINDAPTRTATQGVAASIWDTDRSECKHLVVRFWPSHFSNDVEYVSVVLKLSSLSNGVHNRSNKHKVDFLLNGTVSTASPVETSTEELVLNVNDTLPQIVSFFVSGTLGATTCTVETSHGKVHDDVLRYQIAQNYSGMIVSVWNTTNLEDKEVVVAVWPNLILQDADNFSLVIRNPSKVTLRSNSDRIKFYFQANDEITPESLTTTEPATTTVITQSTDPTMSTATVVTTQSTNLATLVNTPSLSLPFIDSLNGKLTVGIPVAVGALLLIVILLVAVAIIVIAMRSSRKYELPASAV